MKPRNKSISTGSWWCNCLFLLGIIMAVRLMLLAGTSYEVRLLDSDTTDDPSPIYLVESSMWGFRSRSFPLRLRSNGEFVEWEIHRNDNWVPWGFGMEGFHQVEMRDGDWE